MMRLPVHRLLLACGGSSTGVLSVFRAPLSPHTVVLRRTLVACSPTRYDRGILCLQSGAATMTTKAFSAGSARRPACAVQGSKPASSMRICGGVVAPLSSSSQAHVTPPSTVIPLPLSELTAISPLDGRYGAKTAQLRKFFSEYALIRERVVVEVRWLQQLAQHKHIAEVPALSERAVCILNALVDDQESTGGDDEGSRQGQQHLHRFCLEDAQRVKEIERVTKHDVKAIEYWLKEFFARTRDPELERIAEFLHFACTSEDVNNLAYARMVQRARQHSLLPAMRDVTAKLATLANACAATPMLARTHGQPATPTTLGKEFANFAVRLGSVISQVEAVPICGKFNGAVGNFNAHLVAYPNVNWPSLSRSFIEEGLEIDKATLFSTQIEPHDWIAEFAHAVARFNSIILDMDRDMWQYISLGYFRLPVKAGEIGSSTMPHKVNPIDFENSEGNVGVANALWLHLAEKLPVSRLQRDLSDSTVLRNLGTAMGHSLLAYQSACVGLSKLDVVEECVVADVRDQWPVLAEAVQTVMRRYGVSQPYERLKELTRGNTTLDSKAMRAFIAGLEDELPAAVCKELMALTPETYLGMAEEMAKTIVSDGPK